MLQLTKYEQKRKEKKEKTNFTPFFLIKPFVKECEVQPSKKESVNRSHSHCIEKNNKKLISKCPFNLNLLNSPKIS